MTATPAAVELVEVAPRDGFQSIAEPLPTERKIQVIQALLDAGITRMEIGSFVSPRAIPQMADTSELIHAFRTSQGRALLRPGAQPQGRGTGPGP